MEARLYESNQCRYVNQHRTEAEVSHTNKIQHDMKIKLHFNIWLRSNSMHNTVRLSLVHFYQSQAWVIFQLRNNRPVTGLVVKEIFCFKTFSIFNRSCCRPQLNIWIFQLLTKWKLRSRCVLHVWILLAFENNSLRIKKIKCWRNIRQVASLTKVTFLHVCVFIKNNKQ